MAEDDATADAEVDMMFTDKSQQREVLMQNISHFPEEVVVFGAKIKVRAHAIVFHESDGDGNVAYGVENMVPTLFQLFGKRVEEMNMCRMTDVDEDVHSDSLNRMP